MQLIQIRHGQDIVREIRAVMPDVYLRGQLLPGLEGAQEPETFRVVAGAIAVAGAAADGAQADAHVWMDLALPGRIQGIHVGKGIDEFIRKHPRRGFCHGIHETQQRA